MTEESYRTTRFGDEEDETAFEILVPGDIKNKKTKKQPKNLDNLKKEAEMVSIITLIQPVFV